MPQNEVSESPFQRQLTLYESHSLLLLTNIATGISILLGDGGGDKKREQEILDHWKRLEKIAAIPEAYDAGFLQGVEERKKVQLEKDKPVSEEKKEKKKHKK